VYFAKNVANSIFHFNSWLSCQRLCRLLWGYHFHFVDSNRGSNNSVISVQSWHVCLFWSPRRRQRPCLGLLKDGLFQFSTSGSAGHVYSELQATKAALKIAPLQQQNKQIIAPGAARRYAPHRWQFDSRCIYVSPQMGPQSAHG